MYLREIKNEPFGRRSERLLLVGGMGPDVHSPPPLLRLNLALLTKHKLHYIVECRLQSGLGSGLRLGLGTKSQLANDN